MILNQPVLFDNSGFIKSNKASLGKRKTVLALADPGGGPGARAPPDPQIWRPQCTI